MADDGFIPDDGFVPEAAPPAAKKSMLEKVVEPITSYPETYSKMKNEALEQAGHGIEQLSSPKDGWDVAKGAGNVALGSLGYATSPISAGLRTLVGKPVEEATGIPKEYTEFASSLAIPGLGFTRMPGASAIPKAPPRGPLGVTLSEGQTTGELPLIQREQAALRGQTGKPAQARAQEFADQQAGQLSNARENIARDFDPFGSVVAGNPQQAADIASSAVRTNAAQRKAGVTAAYDTAKDLPGEVHADVFRDMGQSIKTDLSVRPDPIVIDNLTPRASKAIDYIDSRINSLKIENKADPLGAPDPNQIVGVTLKGVDQWRRHLSALRRDAFASGDASDGNAMKSVIDAFDDRVDVAINNGAFRGDPRAVQAWNDARAAHADYKSTFSAQKKDPVGRVVEKVLGDRINDPATPNAVADHLWGATGVNPSDLNLGVTKRFKSILGERSPEWSAVKQGLFSRIIEPGADLAQWGPKKTADKINKFLNVDGKEMAAVVFSPAERDAIQSYANLLRRLEVPQAGANWSNTGTAKIFQKIGSNVGTVVGMLVGAGAGHAIGLPPFVGEVSGAALAKGSQALANSREAKAVARQMPILANQAQAYQRAVIAAQKSPTPVTQRMLAGATVSLDSTLRKLGTSIEFPHGTVPAAAEPEQNKRHGGRANQPGQSAKHKGHSPKMPEMTPELKRAMANGGGLTGWVEEGDRSAFESSADRVRRSVHRRAS